MPRSELVQSLLRGLDILKLISSKPEGMRLNELVEATGLKKSTVHNLLRTMAAREFVVKDSLSRFSTGPAVADMANSAGKSTLKEKLGNGLLQLAKLFPEHVITVSTLEGCKIKCIMRISPDLPRMIQTPSDHFFMPYVSVTAIALQAANPELASELEKRFPFEEYGVGKWGTPERFAQLKKEVLQDGFCCRVIEDRAAAAFILPDTMVLGISTSRKIPKFLEQYKSAAENLRLSVWGNKNKA